MELKLPEIKLFGKKIAFPENELLEAIEESYEGIGNENSSGSDSNLYLSKVRRDEENEDVDDKDVNKQEADKISKSKPVKEKINLVIEESQNPKDLADFDNSPDTISLDEEQNPDSENDQSDTNNSQKNLKKPDKIIPCPRCKSMETKFCYYNNYNVNQPRHFCKSCQRYWTAGGTMRNVPVGAGRRKNKNSVSNCSSINISEALHSGFHHPSITPNGTFLSFGSEIPVIEKNASNGNDFVRNSCINVPNRALNQGVKNGHQELVLQNSFPAPISVPVPYYPNHVNYSYPNPVSIPVPGFCPPGFPLPFYPYGIPGSWSLPWLPPVYPSASEKRYMDCNMPNPNNLESNESIDPSKGSILVPKTLRIGDPNEAAMSSIWTTLGIKSDLTNRGGIFKAFQPKNNTDKTHMATTSSLLQANPAALSRSVNFQETA